MCGLLYVAANLGKMSHTKKEKNLTRMMALLLFFFFPRNVWSLQGELLEKTIAVEKSSRHHGVVSQIR